MHLKEFEDGGVGRRLHGVAHGDAVGVGEGEGLGGVLLERLEIVGIARRAHLLDDLEAQLGREEPERLKGVVLRHRNRL